MAYPAACPMCMEAVPLKVPEGVHVTVSPPVLPCRNCSQSADVSAGGGFAKLPPPPNVPLVAVANQELSSGVTNVATPSTSTSVSSFSLMYW